MQANQNQVVERLKKQPCNQEDCLSGHQDNVEALVFDNPQAKKTGLMCTACLLDTSLIQQLLPVQKYVLPIRKYMSLIVRFYQQYLETKESAQWGPSLVKKEGESVHRKIQLFYNDGLKAVLQISQFADSLARKSLESLKKIYSDADFDKLSAFLNEENEMQQQRMMISGELSSVCAKIRLQEGKIRYSTQDAMRRETEQVIGNYKQQIKIAVNTLKQLLEVHQNCLKQILS